MNTIKVFQSVLNKEIEMQYIGKVKYVGTDDYLCFINNKTYNVVLDKYNCVKVVDETDEDYVYSLTEPIVGGKFYYIDDPQDILKNYMSEY